MQKYRKQVKKFERSLVGLRKCHDLLIGYLIKVKKNFQNLVMLYKKKAEFNVYFKLQTYLNEKMHL
jgi:hypothetical protein